MCKEIDHMARKVLRVATQLTGYLTQVFDRKLAEDDKLAYVQKEYAQLEEESQLLKQVLSHNKTLDVNVHQILKPSFEVKLRKVLPYKEHVIRINLKCADIATNTENLVFNVEEPYSMTRLIVSTYSQTDPIESPAPTKVIEKVIVYKELEKPSMIDEDVSAVPSMADKCIGSDIASFRFKIFPNINNLKSILAYPQIYKLQCTGRHS